MIRLGVNIDHVATIRQARCTFEPDPVWAAAAAQMGGADGITIHLREDRRHIQDRDLEVLKKTVSVKLNLECACNDEMIQIACDLQPQQVCLVPERREEVTTEGGLAIETKFETVGKAIEQLRKSGIDVSLFIDPELKHIELAQQLAADRVELHTGSFANASSDEKDAQLTRLKLAADAVADSPMVLDAGHGLTYHNVVPVSQLNGLDELNIGHSIVSRSIMVGMENAVREMKTLINSYAVSHGQQAIA